MRLNMQRPRHSFRDFEGKPSRFVFKWRWEKSDKDYDAELSLPEVGTYDAQQNVKESDYRSADVLAELGLGWEIVSRDPEVEGRLSHIMLGIRRRLSNTIGNLLPEGLRRENIDAIMRNPTLRQQYPKLKAGKGFLKQVGTLLAPDRIQPWFRSRAERIHDDLFGTERDPQLQRIHICRNIWRSLTPAQQVEVRAQLDAMVVTPLPGPRGPVRVEVYRLANATAQQLVQLRNQAQVGNVRVFPQQVQLSGREFEMADAPGEDRLIDHLIQHRRNENKRIKEMLSTSVYDSEELRLFLRELREAPLRLFYKTDNQGRPLPITPEDLHGESVFGLLNEILRNNALTPIKNNPTVQALLNKIRELYQQGDIDRVYDLLLKIRDSLPNVEPEKNASEESTEEDKDAEKQSSLGKKVAESKQNLQDHYADAQSIYERLNSVLDNIQRTTGALGGGGSSRDTGLGELQKQRDALMKEKTELLKKIRRAENELKKNVGEMTKLLGNTQVPGITNFSTSTANSTEQELFGISAAPGAGPTPPVKSALRDAIENLPDDKLDEVGSAKRQRLSPIQLLTRIHLQEEIENYGDHVTTDMMDRAKARAMSDVTAVLNIPLDRAANRELSEGLDASNWQAFKKIWRAKVTSKTVYDSRKLLEGITREGSGLEKFGPLHPSMADEELHVWLNENPEMDTDGLNLYVHKIGEALKSFRYDGGKVELLDSDAIELRRFIGRIQNIVKVRQLFASGFDARITADADVMAENMKHIDEFYTSDEEKEKGLWEQLKDKVGSVGQWVSNLLFKRKMSPFVKEVEEGKMNARDAKSWLDEHGLADDPRAQALLTGALYVAQHGKFHQRAWKRAKAAPRKIRSAGKTFGGGAVKTGKFLGKTGYYLTSPIWWPAKKIGQGGMWVGRKTWGGVKAVGRGIKKFWDWV